MPASLLPAIFVLSSAKAQSAKDDNVVIKNRSEYYEFSYGDAKNPVIVNQQFTTTYRCDGFRTVVPYVEFYDDQSSINEVAGLGRREKRLST